MGPSPEERQEAELLRHASWIRRLALVLVGDAARAEDLVQETWLAALRRRPSTDQPLRPWLGTVLRNAARQAFRGGARREARQAQASEPAPVTGPEELAQRLEAERGMTDELARLEEPFRSTLMLRYYEGLEPSEIARRQGLPAGTVRWRVKRGLERLRERLDDRFGERALWSALILPLARPPLAPPPTGAATATAAASGALAMHALTKLGIGATAVVALAVGLRMGGALPDALWPFEHEAPAALAMRPIPAELEPAEAPPDAPAATEAPRREALHTVDAPAARDEPAEPGLACVVLARAVDELGAPIAGASLRATSIERLPPARSGRDGELRLELPGVVADEFVQLALTARGFAARGVVAVPRAGETTHLGTLELAPGGVVSGFVRDVLGQPVADAEITIDDGEIPRRELERRRLRPAENAIPSASSAADGSFSLDGVPTGHVRVWARRQSYLGAFSAPVEVAAGQESYGLELVLEGLAPENRIAGVVLDPEDAPVPNAKLEYRHGSETTGTWYSGDREADAHGRFEFLVPADTRLWITASDPADRWGPGSATDVGTGAAELVVRLTRTEQFEVTVVDGSGAPVSTFGVASLSGDGQFQHQGTARGEHDGGRVELRLPSEPFVLRVDAPGFELAEVGPLDPGGLPEPLVVRLAPLPGLGGSVWSSDGPVEGASVSLRPEVEAGTTYEKNGFRALFQGASETVTTDVDGRFLLTPREPGRYVVRAERSGWAPAVSEVIELGPSLSAPYLELELGRGGAIEGRVVQLDGSDPSGTIVGLSRGDGEDRTVRVGPDGAYRFERLTPGDWLVVERDEEIRPGWTVTNTSDSPRKAYGIEWSCRVQEGRTTHFDLVIGDRETCIVEGRLRIDGAAPTGWVAKLLEDDDLFDSRGAPGTSLDSTGAFRLTTAEPGRYWLALSEASRQERFLLDVVHLTVGLNGWELDVETGTLDVGGVPAWSGEDAPAYVHIWNGPGSKKAFTVLAGDASGRARIEKVPAGKGRIVRPDPTTYDFDAWPLVTEIELRAGETRSVELE